MDGGLDHFFPNSILLDIAKDGFTIIWRLLKNMNFHKIWRLWLKNCARHAHFNFELLKGVAASFFELYPSNFSQACIFYRQTNDVFIICLYLLQDSSNSQITDFLCPKWPPRCTICASGGPLRMKKVSFLKIAVCQLTKL